MAATRIACVGCGALVDDVDGPTHRYLGASAGCWAVYSPLTVANLAIPMPEAALTVDAYAIQHPGVEGPQSTPSVWIHLITLQLVLEDGWRPDQAIRIRKLAADAFDRWPWLEPPRSMGPVTVVDLASAPARDVAGVGRAWVDGAWAAWAGHHQSVRAQAARLVAGLD